MKIKFVLLLAILFLSKISFAQQHFFTTEYESPLAKQNEHRAIVPEKYKTVHLDIAGLQSFLASLPNETDIQNITTAPVFELPMPDGTTAKFNVWQSSIMEDGLAQQLPNIKTYAGQGITDKSATIRFDVTELGFHAMILSPVSGSVFIDPYSQSTTSRYIVYFKKDYRKEITYAEKFIKLNPKQTKQQFRQFPAGQCNGAQLRKYRLAVACDNQYAKAATGLGSPTKAQAMSAITTSVNRVTGVFEAEVSIRLILIANNLNIVYVSTSGDPYGPWNNDPDSLVSINQRNITQIIGSGNFDIGHIFSTGGGGLAIIGNGNGNVCDNDYKAMGVTGSSSPVGDPYDIDFVAHEMGHQFGGNHTFNANTGSCNGNANNFTFPTATNCEPGSGTTIMAYAGICDDVGVINDLQPHSDPQFHAISMAEILDYSINDVGNNCAVTSATGNTPPTASAGADYTIPINTPFILTGTGSDANTTDVLSYSWEQTDVFGAVGDWNATPQTINIPLFRSFTPKTTGVRYFPKLSDVVNGITTIGERLPSITRAMHFRLTVRDNRANGGGSCFDDATINANATGGAFTVTYPTATGITWLTGETRTVTWNKGSTSGSPFNVANVAIELSTDGGYTYPITILASTPNDGTQAITVPNNITTTARIRVRSLGNVFYNISSNNFIIQLGLPVKWLTVKAVKENKNAVVQWTVNEINTQYYEVEKSVDGIKFEKFATVNAISDNTNIHSYSTVDFNTIIGKNYYRIKQIDKDGNYAYSNIVFVVFDAANRNYSLYPNPTNNIINIYNNSTNATLNIFMYDAIGRLIKQVNNTAIASNQTISINVSNLAKGVYTINLQNTNKESEWIKFLVD